MVICRNIKTHCLDDFVKIGFQEIFKATNMIINFFFVKVTVNEMFTKNRYLRIHVMFYAELLPFYFNIEFHTEIQLCCGFKGTNIFIP